MFSSLMPQRKEFFELLAAHSEQVVAGANATLRLVNGWVMRVQTLRPWSPKSMNTSTMGIK
jgi:hypothetical protein